MALMTLSAASAVLNPAVIGCIRPRPEVNTWNWAGANIVMPQDSKIRGAFRCDLFPQWREPLDCFDDPRYNRITIQAAAQVGKTVVSQVALAKTAATNPHPMAFADADERSTRRVISRTWRLFERCPPLAPLCPSTRMQSTERMELATCLIHGAWSGSASSAADYGAFVVVLNETDKMKTKTTDQEAPFPYLMGERTKGYVGSKIIEISTPTLKKTSYIEQQRLLGDNRRRLVPCPHCNHFQELTLGDSETVGGIKFERLAGKLNPAKARETAYYQCEKCKKKITDQHRYEMLNEGIWAKEGQTVAKLGKLRGKPVRDGSHASFGPIGTLHSLLPGITHGLIAEEYVRSKLPGEGATRRRRNFANSWEGKTWDDQPRQLDADALCELLGVDINLGIVPSWAKFLTTGVDVGSVGNDYVFYFAVIAWGIHSRAHLVDYGIAFGESELLEQLNREYPIQDEETSIRSLRNAIDSGSFTNAVYELVKRMPNAWAVKGSSKDTEKPFNPGDFLEMYKPALQRAGLTARQQAAKVKMGKYDLLSVNTSRTQEWFEDRINGFVSRDDSNALTIPMEALAAVPVPEINLPKHLTGDFKDARNNWTKRYDDQHIRDAIRYGQVVAWLYTKNGQNWDREIPRISTSGGAKRETLTSQAPAAFTTPSGQAFVASQRTRI